MNKNTGLIIGIVVVIVVLGIGTYLKSQTRAQQNNGIQESLYVEDLGLDDKNLPIATIKIKGYGEIVAQLYPSIAPNTVDNFIELAQSGFYDGLTFHRIAKDFVMQGGDPNGNGSGGPGYSIHGEFAANGFDGNNLAHKKGVLSMARSSANDSAGSQFFVMTGDAPHLDGKYAAFGKVIEGYDVIDTINNVQVKSQKTHEPVEEVVIESITIDLKGQTYDGPVKINAQ